MANQTIFKKLEELKVKDNININKTYVNSVIKQLQAKLQDLLDYPADSLNNIDFIRIKEDLTGFLSALFLLRIIDDKTHSLIYDEILKKIQQIK